MNSARFLAIVVLASASLFFGLSAWADGKKKTAEAPKRPDLAESFWKELPTDAEGKVTLSDAAWKKRLTPEQYEILRGAGTERRFTGEYTHNHADGFYRCAACGQILFSSDTKYDSGSGWPSFYQAAADGVVTLHEDESLYMTRTEVRCGRCGGHLGHVFKDGPAPTGDRFCINSAALVFDEQAPTEALASTAGDRTSSEEKDGKPIPNAPAKEGCDGEPTDAPSKDTAKDAP